MKLRTGEDVLHGLLPLNHIYGLVIVLFGCIAKSAKLIMLLKFELQTFLESIQKHKVFPTLQGLLKSILKSAKLLYF